MMAKERTTNEDTSSSAAGQLADPLPAAALGRRAVRSHRRWLVCLFLLALTARMGMAWKQDVLCPDGTLYISLAQAWDDGDLASGLRELQLNTFPLILMTLHQIGLDWHTGGQLWGVLVSSLAVLPLFGWVRRQFNQPTAIIACCLYATHPELVEWSPEVIRDPTFWFLALLTLYLSWRAWSETRFVWMLAAIFSWTLATLTRVEGLFLLAPWIGWLLVRWNASPEQRSRLLLGAAACVLVPAGILWLANGIVLHGHTDWQTVRTVPLQIAGQWLRAPFSGSVADLARQSALPWPARLGHFLHTLQAGLHPLFILLLLTGIIRYRRSQRRGTHLPLALVALAVLCGMWMHLWYAGQSSTRYPLLIVLIGLPWAALGLVAISHSLARWSKRKTLEPAETGSKLWATMSPAWRWFGRQARFPSRSWSADQLTIALLGIFALMGLVDAWTTRYESRRARAALGRWIHSQFGSGTEILGTSDLNRLVGYYAHSRVRVIPETSRGIDIVEMVRRYQPQLVLVSTSKLQPTQYAVLLEQSESLQLQRVDNPHLAHEPGQIVILLDPRGIRAADGSSESKWRR